jgi:hypothetical protein
MTPKNVNPSKPPAPFGSWQWYLECEERSLDRMIEMMRRQIAAARAILGLKNKLICAGLSVTLTSREHAMVAADFEGWADEERDPKKAAELASLGRLARTLSKSVQKREAAAKAKAKRPPKKGRRS